MSELDDLGCLPTARHIISPNYNDRPEGESIRLIVIHAISLPPGQFGGAGVEQLFTNTLNPHEHPYYSQVYSLKVSAHFFIRRDGALIQFVPCEKRAWHAGQSCWQDQENCNDYSIGIEMEGCDELPFEKKQYEQLICLIKMLKNSYPIEDIVGHSDIAPGRKTDPGHCFDWGFLSYM